MRKKVIKKYNQGGTTSRANKIGEGVGSVLGTLGSSIGAANPVLGAALGIGAAVLPEVIGAFAKPSQYTPIRNNTRAFRNGGDTQLSNDTILVQGNPSITDGNLRRTPSGVVGRFDHDELITQLPDREFALSPNLINPRTGNFLANDGKKIKVAQSKAEKKINDPEAETTKRLLQQRFNTLINENIRQLNRIQKESTNISIPKNIRPFKPESSLETNLLNPFTEGSNKVKDGLDSNGGGTTLNFNESARPFIDPFNTNSLEHLIPRVTDQRGIINHSSNVPEVELPINTDIISNSSRNPNNIRTTNVIPDDVSNVNPEIEDREKISIDRLPSLGANVQNRSGLRPKLDPNLIPNLNNNLNESPEKKKFLNRLGQDINNLPIGEILQIPGIISRFKGINQVKRESANLLPNRQISPTPIINRLQSNFNSNLNNIRTSSSNVNRALKQQAFSNLNRATIDALLRISNQNANLTQQTRRFNIGEINRVSQINAQNRAAQDQARLAAFDSIGNVGRGINKKRTNRKAVESISQSFPDIAQFLLRDLNIRTNGN